MPWSKSLGTINNHEFHIQYSKDFQRKLDNIPFTTKFVTPEGNIFMHTIPQYHIINMILYIGMHNTIE